MEKPVVGIVMGSASDYETLGKAEDVLSRFGVPYEISVVSAHRMPEEMFEYGRTARARGLKLVIAGAGGAAHLPGMLSSLTTLPVLGVPVESRMLKGVDSLLSIVQMPAGVPTATFAIGPAGAATAALFAVRVLALDDATLAGKLEKHREEIAQAARDGNRKVRARLAGSTETA